MKRTRAVRLWLVALSVVAVAIGAGCGGAGAAAARAVGAGAGRAAAPAVRQAVHVPVYRPPVVVVPVSAPRPVVNGNQFRVGNTVDTGARAGTGDGVMVHGHFPAEVLVPNSGGDQKKK